MEEKTEAEIAVLSAAVGVAVNDLIFKVMSGDHYYPELVAVANAVKAIAPEFDKTAYYMGGAEAAARL